MQSHRVQTRGYNPLPWQPGLKLTIPAIAAGIVALLPTGRNARRHATYPKRGKAWQGTPSATCERVGLIGQPARFFWIDPLGVEVLPAYLAE